MSDIADASLEAFMLERRCPHQQWVHGPGLVCRPCVIAWAVAEGLAAVRFEREECAGVVQERLARVFQRGSEHDDQVEAAVLEQVVAAIRDRGGP